MLNYNEVKPKKYVVLDGEPYEVIDSNVFRKQKRKPVNQTKLKNLISGKVKEHSFHQSDKVAEADLETRKITFLYPKGDERWFCAESDKADRFTVEASMLGDQDLFIKQNTNVDALIFNGDIIGIKLPIKDIYTVKEAPPNIKGNTAQGGSKPVVIETGASVTTPLFIEAGDTIEVNTETGEYVGRIS